MSLKDQIKKTLAMVSLSAFLCFGLTAQNLVPNPGFEIYSGCPNDFDQLDSTINWHSVGDDSPDYYNSCASLSTDVSVPQNLAGSQSPNSGNAYAGFIVYAWTVANNLNAREFIQSQLTDTLEAGKAYCLSMNVSLADSMYFAISNIGAHLSSSAINPILLSPPHLASYIPQVKNASGNILINKTNWTKIEGSFTAVGNEQFITIGNFDFDNQTDTQRVSPGNDPNWRQSYYYIDDISLEEITPGDAGPNQTITQGDSIQIGMNLIESAEYSWSPAGGMNDTTVANPYVKPTQTMTYYLTKIQCGVSSMDSVTVFVDPNSVREEKISSSISLFPNPSTGEFTINAVVPFQNGQLHIFDINGKLVSSYLLKGQKTSLNLAELKEGVYFYTIISNNKVLKRDKIVIIK
jgi:hypothetical protein